VPVNPRQVFTNKPQLMSMTCHNCGETGHLQRECSRSRQQRVYGRWTHGWDSACLSLL
jgi:hypothetical protein